MHITQKITPCLWFDDQAEQAVAFYTGVFRNSKVLDIARYGEAGHDVHGMLAGSVMAIAFELDGQTFTALNGGPVFRCNEAISFQIYCDSQEEVDYYWARLSAGGDGTAQQCGWLKDRYGVSWQVVPTALIEMLTDVDPEKSGRAMEAMLKMKKIDIEQIRQAYGAQ
jgi:predicted 3-demethylubiquinone-9 3-methyltransferase (glyoxalase superfamily)